MEYTQPTILVVDDDEEILKLIGLTLYRNHYNVILRGSGEGAKAVLEGSKVDLLVTDLVMPDTNGLELLKHIKGKYPNLSIITMTGADFDFSSHAEYLGSSNLLPKPFKMSELVKIVDSAMKG